MSASSPWRATSALPGVAIPQVDLNDIAAVADLGHRERGTPLAGVVSELKSASD